MADFFGGAGSIVRSALLLGRRAVYVDINPLAALTARVEIEGVEGTRLAMAAEEILLGPIRYRDSAGHTRMRPLEDFYGVRCRCGNRMEANYFIWRGTRVTGAKAICKCGRTFVTAHRVGPRGTPLDYFPNDRFEYPSGKPFKKRRQVKDVSELFTRRNLILLSNLLHAIHSAKADSRTKRGLLLAFVSILYQSSRMSRPDAGPWGINSYWIPHLHLERNPYILFSLALQRLLRLQHVTNAVPTQRVLNDDSKLAIMRKDAARTGLPDSSVDLFVTDPPFTDEIQYLELSQMAASWLGMRLDFTNEIVVNTNQGKNKGRYMQLLGDSFAEMYRILKVGHYAVIMFHDEDVRTVTAVQSEIESAGFKVRAVNHEVMHQRNVGDRDTEMGKRLTIFTCRKPGC